MDCKRFGTGIFIVAILSFLSLQADVNAIDFSKFNDLLNATACCNGTFIANKTVIDKCVKFLVAKNSSSASIVSTVLPTTTGPILMNNGTRDQVQCCFMDCVFNETGIQKEGKIIAEAIPEKLKIHWAKCTSKPIQPQESRCKFAERVGRCVFVEAIISCPAPNWTNSAICNVTKTFFQSYHVNN